MKQVILRQGEAVVEDVPAPLVEPGTVLVTVDHSCISVGTELSGLRMGGLPLWRRALRQPQNVQRAVRAAFTVGPRRMWNIVSGQLAAGTPSGYSASGFVLEVGTGVIDLDPGDRVACAGAQFAHHAEIIRVPRNLVVPVREDLPLRDASTVTLGAIAMQGVRRAEPTLGETFVVIGLGALGQLTSQLLKASGARVIAVDIDAERVALAVAIGADLGIDPAEELPEQQVARLTDGVGADGVIITAATPSDAVVSTAFKMCRKKGRVVLVGDVGLELNRADFYAKEIDFRISCSYGPGRYDRSYEEEGLDYPVAYVRWTENRNMAEYLRLLAQRRVRLERLIDAVHPLSEAGTAYRTLNAEGRKPVMVLLSYPVSDKGQPLLRRVTTAGAGVGRVGRVRIALIGAGGFAKGMHLPNLRTLSGEVELRAVVSRTGHNATSTARLFGAAYASTDPAEVLNDPEVDAVIIATRHHLHAPLVLAALEAGKHVLVEKPLCVKPDELTAIEAWFAAKGDGAPILLTGFNRRFSRYAEATRRALSGRSGPALLAYQMNAGYLPLDHWTHGPEGGGRNVGEACHIYDLATSLIGCHHRTIQATSVTPSTAHYSRWDNFVATCAFEDGSLLTLAYTAMGHQSYPKEQFALFVDGKVVEMRDYTQLRVHGVRGAGVRTAVPEKGQMEELVAFTRAVRDGGPWPIPLWEQVQAMEIAFAVEAQLRIQLRSAR